MLNLFERCCARASFLRPFSLMMAGLGLLLVAASLFIADFYTWLMPAFLLFLWSLLAFSFLTLFAQLPEAAAPHQGRLLRLKNKLKRGLYWLLAVVFLLLTLGILGMTLRGLIIFFKG